MNMMDWRFTAPNDKFQTGSESYSTLISTGYQKFGFGYQTVNDLYSDWILRIFQTLIIRKFDGLLITFEYYQFTISVSSLKTSSPAYINLLKDYVDFRVLQ
jgi:hypothetical protein